MLEIKSIRPEKVMFLCADCLMLSMELNQCHVCGRNNIIALVMEKEQGHWIISEESYARLHAVLSPVLRDDAILKMQLASYVLCQANLKDPDPILVQAMEELKVPVLPTQEPRYGIVRLRKLLMERFVK